MPASTRRPSSTIDRSSLVPTTTTPAAVAALSTIAAPSVSSGVTHATRAMSPGQMGGHTVTGSSRKYP